VYAVVGQVKVDMAREEEARKLLDDFVVPSARALTGFVGGYWARAANGDTGHSLLLFDSEANARASAGQIWAPGGGSAPVSLATVTVCEVLAQA
jgi:hypothetical protein